MFKHIDDHAIINYNEMNTVIHVCIAISTIHAWISSDICTIHAVYIGLLVAAVMPEVLGVNTEVN